MTFDLTPDQRAMTEHMAWLINNPSTWADAASLAIRPEGAEACYLDLAEWTSHRHRESGYCHKEVRPADGVRIFSCVEESHCHDLCACGEPIPHSDDAACSSEHNPVIDDEAIEVAS